MQFSFFKKALLVSLLSILINLQFSLICLASQAPIIAQPISNNIVQTAISSAPEFSTLVTAIKAAGLVDNLSGNDPLTIFAPTNQAFAKIPADTLNKLLLPENKPTLSKILTYHVVSGYIASSDLIKAVSIKTVEMSPITISVVDSKIKLNTNTNVANVDINTSNGIIHSIDTVLIPASVNLNNLTSPKTNFDTVRTGGASTNFSLIAFGIAFGIMCLSTNKNNLD